MESSLYNTRRVVWTNSHVFSLTNSPATFQAIINELLRDLVNIGKVAVFIDGVIVGTEEEKEYNKFITNKLLTGCDTWTK